MRHCCGQTVQQIRVSAKNVETTVPESRMQEIRTLVARLEANLRFWILTCALRWPPAWCVRRGVVAKTHSAQCVTGIDRLAAKVQKKCHRMRITDKQRGGRAGIRVAPWCSSLALAGTLRHLSCAPAVPFTNVHSSVKRDSGTL